MLERGARLQGGKLARHRDEREVRAGQRLERAGEAARLKAGAGGGSWGLGEQALQLFQRLDGGALVTAMCRNGTDFGIRVAGLGDAWFTAPVEMPQGLYFPGFSAADSTPGRSASRRATRISATESR